MPTVLRKGGFVVRIYGPPREHPPPHVHIERGDNEMVVIRLGTPEAPPLVWKVFGMSRKNVLKAYRLVEQHQTQLSNEWWRIRGGTDSI